MCSLYENKTHCRCTESAPMLNNRAPTAHPAATWRQIFADFLGPILGPFLANNAGKVRCTAFFEGPQKSARFFRGDIGGTSFPKITTFPLNPRLWPNQGVPCLSLSQLFGSSAEALELRYSGRSSATDTKRFVVKNTRLNVFDSLVPFDPRLF